MLWNEDQLPRVKKGNKAYVERKVGECQWKAHGQCSKEDSCSFSHDLLAFGNKGKGPASHSKAKQTDGEEQKSSHGSGNKQKTHLIRVKFHAESNSVKNPSCKFWPTPVCPNYESEKCVHGDKCHFRHVEVEGKPNEK